jgi:hypothetical protein
MSGDSSTAATNRASGQLGDEHRPFRGNASPRCLKDISRLFVRRTEPCQGSQREEHHRWEAGRDERGVRGRTEKMKLYADLAATIGKGLADALASSDSDPLST